jgi:hypothetical protein
MTDATQAPAFRRGTEEIEEAIKNASVRFQRDQFFSLEDGQTEILRFITPNDQWIVVNQYGAIRTKPKPDGFEGNWPSLMSAVSRSDPAFEGIFTTDYLKDNPPLDKDGEPATPSPRTWALACRREEVRGDGSEALGGPDMKGKLLGFKDKTREVAVVRKDADGNEVRGEDGKLVVDNITEKDIVVVNMGHKNFFALLIGFARRYGSITDRDYYIRRKGGGVKNTTYEIVPADPVPVDLSAYQHRPLEEVVMDRASDEYIGRFFIPGWVDPDAKPNGTQGAPPEQQAKPSNEPSNEQLAAMRERIMGGGGQPEAQAPAPDAPPPAATGGGMMNFG